MIKCQTCFCRFMTFHTKWNLQCESRLWIMKRFKLFHFSLWVVFQFLFGTRLKGEAKKNIYFCDLDYLFLSFLTVSVAFFLHSSWFQSYFLSFSQGRGGGEKGGGQLKRIVGQWFFSVTWCDQKQIVFVLLSPENLMKVLSLFVLTDDNFPALSIAEVSRLIGSKCLWQVSVERHATRVKSLTQPYHLWPVDGDVNLLWLSCGPQYISLFYRPSPRPRPCPCLSLRGTGRAQSGLTPRGGSCHQFLASSFEDHEIVDPRRTISAFSLLTGEELTCDYNVTGMSQSVCLTLWTYYHFCGTVCLKKEWWDQ